MCLLLYFERVPEVLFFCYEGINISCLYSVLRDLHLTIFLFQQNEKSQLHRPPGVGASPVVEAVLLSRRSLLSRYLNYNYQTIFEYSLIHSSS